MKYLILAVIGLIVMIVSLILLFRNLGLKMNGTAAEAEVIAVGEDTRKSMFMIKGKGAQSARTVSGYVHTLRYEAKGRTIEAKDRTGYVQPFSKGSVHTIIYSRTKPEIFDYAEQIDRNLKLFGGLAAVGAVFAVRFFMMGMK